MSRYVANFVQKCNKCQTNHANVMHIRPLIIVETPQRAFDIETSHKMGHFPKAIANNAEVRKYRIYSYGIWTKY